MKKKILATTALLSGTVIGFLLAKKYMQKYIKKNLFSNNKNDIE